MAARIELNAAELRRYSRHMLLPEVGLDGQRRLKASRALIVGLGGLGSPVALYLAAAGVGTLGLADFDVVDESNLQRQLLHGTSTVGQAKVNSAVDRLTEINPHIALECFREAITRDNALDLVSKFDVVLDGTDNFGTRYLINDACVLAGVPNVYASVLRFEGQASVFATERGPCYRCLFPEPPPPGLIPSCAEAGVLGVLPGLLGTIQATEALKILLNIGTSLEGRMLLVDALGMGFDFVDIARDPYCATCGVKARRTLGNYDIACGSESGSEPTNAGTLEDLTPKELLARLASGVAIDIIDVREPFELEIAAIAGARNVPLRLLATELASFDKHRELIVLCKAGSRSQTAVQTLRAAGYTNVRQLAGGIMRWRQDVDPSMNAY